MGAAREQRGSNSGRGWVDQVSARSKQRLSQSFAAIETLVILAPNMKKPVVVAGSIILVFVIICAAFIGLVALNDSKMDTLTRPYPE